VKLFKTLFSDDKGKWGDRKREKERNFMGKMDVASSMIRRLENEKVKIY
jgi:hypothetical protein